MKMGRRAGSVLALTLLLLCAETWGVNGADDDNSNYHVEDFWDKMPHAPSNVITMGYITGSKKQGSDLVAGKFYDRPGARISGALTYALEQVQKEYRRLVRRCQWMPDCVRVRYGRASSSGSRDNSSSGNVMSRFLRGKKRHSDHGDSSNNSAKPFLHKDRGYLSSSSAPSSSDGATSSRLSSETTNNNNRKNSSFSTSRSSGSDVRFLKTPEFCGIAGDLSEVPDCSVVDSEFVSEYCQQNMQASAESKRYSSASEDSGKGEGVEEDEREEAMEQSLDRLAALSEESLLKRRSDCVSGSDFGEGDTAEGFTENGISENAVPDEGRFVNPAQAPIKESGDEGDEDDDGGEEVETKSQERQPLMLKQTDSERVLINNAVNKPRDVGKGDPESPKLSPSLTHIPIQENGGEPFYTSVPCLKYQPARNGPTVGSKDSDSVIMNSLPNLNHAHTNGAPPSTDHLVVGQSPSVKRHSSDGRVSFNNFRSSGSEC